MLVAGASPKRCGTTTTAPLRAMPTMDLPETLVFKIGAWRQSGTPHPYDEEGFDKTS